MSFQENAQRQRIYQIVTHDGKAHRDEYVSCSLLLGLCPGASVVRHRVTASELENPCVAVVDTGRIHDPDLSCFDHHQGTHTQPTCALTLILDALGELDHARRVWPWLLPTEILDSGGIAAVMRMTGVPRHSLDAQGVWIAAASPIEKYMLQSFSSVVNIRKGGAMHEIMARSGQAMIRELHDSRARFALLDKICEAYEVGAEDPIHILWVPLPSSSKPDSWLTGYTRGRSVVPDMVVMAHRYLPGYYIRFVNRLEFTTRDLADKLGPAALSNSSGVTIESLTPEKLQEAVAQLV